MHVRARHTLDGCNPCSLSCACYRVDEASIGSQPFTLILCLLQPRADKTADGTDETEREDRRDACAQAQMHRTSVHLDYTWTVCARDL